ncbi:putative Uncharacterized transcriptional regulatory protein C1F7.11c [Glarea lozoyensis 74030]|uniref:Putative Uncharacterized transcriptional regulatory protein C1F7.11c n=1 Tax=Glarea lozoyensis (strain ATCC 74030 / MF5533) TaxID=1104152 RepID=H0EJN1_GLAL7|nr:putative Uncharacterized transcriptional regulatory protein C1F7.11c [Glarea lozoyensis 74030]
MGLPSMVRAETHDIQEPRNIYDWELYENMTDLPSSRPRTEITPVSYLLAKDILLKAIGGIVDLLSSLKPYSYEEVLRLDDELSRAQAEMPAYLQMRSLEDSKGDPLTLISRRFQLEILFHQAMVDWKDGSNHLGIDAFDPRWPCCQFKICCTRKPRENVPDAQKVYRVLAHMLDMLGIIQTVENPQIPEVPATSALSLSNEISQGIIGLENEVPLDTMNIDWAMWDSFIEGTSFEDAFGSMLTPPTTNSTVNTDTIASFQTKKKLAATQRAANV